MISLGSRCTLALVSLSNCVLLAELRVPAFQKDLTNDTSKHNGQMINKNMSGLIVM